MNKTLILSLSLFASIVMISPAQAMHKKEACRAVKSNLLNISKNNPELVPNALRTYTNCINATTRALYKSYAPKAERVEEICSTERYLFLLNSFSLNAKDSEVQTALAKYEACQKKELVELYEQKKQNKQ